MRMLHLNKSGFGMTSKTACGRNILRTPMSANWKDYKNELVESRCAKCEASKQAELNKRSDAKNEQANIETEAAKWIPEDTETTFKRDAELIAAYKAKKNK